MYPVTYSNFTVQVYIIQNRTMNRILSFNNSVISDTILMGRILCIGMAST
jgi:hypothetical protein